MSLTPEQAQPGARIWVLAYGWWRRGVVVAPLRGGVNVVVRYSLVGGTEHRRKRRLDGEQLQPESFDPASGSASERPIAKLGLWP